MSSPTEMNSRCSASQTQLILFLSVSVKPRRNLPTFLKHTPLLSWQLYISCVPYRIIKLLQQSMKILIAVDDITAHQKSGQKFFAFTEWNALAVTAVTLYIVEDGLGGEPPKSLLKLVRHYTVSLPFKGPAAATARVFLEQQRISVGFSFFHSSALGQF